MADGSDFVGKKFKIPQDDIATVYGMEIYMAILGLPFKEFGIELNVDWYQDDKPMAEFCARLQNYRALYASLIICSFANPPSEMILEIVNKATGLNLSMTDFKKLGERNYMIKRLFNSR